jgi:hypothetical protein
METKEMSHACCGGKHKKVFIILAVLVFLAVAALSVAVIGWKMHEGFSRNGLVYGGGNFTRGQMMNNRGGYVVPPIVSSVENQFVLPQDAARSGEIAIVVNNLEAAQQAVADIAAKDNGNVYETFIAYASNNLKNGSIVVQVPADNFEAAFGDLKKVGSSVVQEKTSRIAPVNYYPTPLAANENPVASDSTDKVATPESAAQPTDATAAYPTKVQNKGYIKVVFVDYGSAANTGKTTIKQSVAGNMMGVGNSFNQDMKNNLLIIVGVKLIFLIAIFGLLIAVFKKIFHRIKRRKENKKVVHVVRQMPKARTRIVRIQKKK